MILRQLYPNVTIAALQTPFQRKTLKVKPLSSAVTNAKSNGVERVTTVPLHAPT
jgi:hypothetical protein